MLDRLLAELNSGQTMSVEGLASRLETTPALVEMMLEHLQRQGSIETVETCGEGCEVCPLGALCKPEKRRRLWQIKLTS